MPSAVSTRVNERPEASDTVFEPLVYEPLAMPIRATPPVTETSLKSGFPLGKLAPTRTTWTRPLTVILAAPFAASVRDGLWLIAAVVVPVAGVLLLPLELELVLPEVGADAFTCWTNGSLPVKWLKE
jgi:hypothetical protein